MRDVHLLLAVRLINRFHFEEAGFPTKSELRFVAGQSPEEIFDLASKHTKVLRKELKRFAEYLKKQEETGRFFYEAKNEAEFYMARLGRDTA